MLLTNDDGYTARGLLTLRDALLDAGYEVMVVAPEQNHSGRSHGVGTSTEPLRLLPQPSGAATSFSCSGSPADCVRVAVLGDLLPRPDIVVSGMNHGANAGEDIHYSATVAAAAEAALLGLPAIAVSQHGPESDVPFLADSPLMFPHAGYVVALIAWTLDNGLPDAAMLNVNLPHGADAQVASVCPVGRRDWAQARVSVEVVDSGGYAAHLWTMGPPEIDAPGTDFALLKQGNATINVLSAARGLHDTFDVHGPHLATAPRGLRPVSDGHQVVGVHCGPAHLGG